MFNFTIKINDRCNARKIIIYNKTTSAVISNKEITITKKITNTKITQIKL